MTSRRDKIDMIDEREIYRCVCVREREREREERYERVGGVEIEHLSNVAASD